MEEFPIHSSLLSGGWQMIIDMPTTFLHFTFANTIVNTSHAYFVCIGNVRFKFTQIEHAGDILREPKWGRCLYMMSSLVCSFS